ncbi:MAG: trehalose-6-phosphate synthase [Actinobacteria bacterium]|nr:MAG: trehalose-6-phosphate synthase [Actinomycetota bacterium]
MQTEKEYHKQIRTFLKNKTFIVASNRGPYEFNRDEHGNLTKRRGGGGLVSALMALGSVPNLVWMASAKSDTDRQIGLFGQQINEPSLSLNVKFVDIDKKVYQPFYNEISNKLFWYTQHLLWNTPYSPTIDLKTYRAWQNGYREANKTFALSIASEANKSANPLIFIQDYHLYLAPKMLRPLLKKGRILHFTHIPWPSSEIWSLLPDLMVKETISGLMGSDIIAFHSLDYVNNFLETVSKYFPVDIDSNRQEIYWGKRRVLVKAYPISISTAQLASLATSKEVMAHEKELLAKNKGKIILRVDRAELSKNIIRGFLAYELLLKNNPALAGRVTFLAYLYETRNSNDYSQYLRSVKRLVKKINDKYGQKDWTPIKLRVADNFLQSLAAYKVYDVLLVNSIFDGMNLVSKEGPLVNKKNGVLILSKNCGAHNELGSFAYIVNPFDIFQTANIMKQSLILSKEHRRQKALLLKETVKRNNSLKWLYYQLKILDSLQTSQDIYLKKLHPIG